jgi:hypothetical protein
MTSEDDTKEMEPERITVKQLLYPLVRPAGSRPVPAALDAAETKDKRARAAYDAGDYLQAAALFLEVAERLRLPDGEPYADTFTANRTLTYANAVAAWIMADKLDEARRALTEAAADPHCAEAIARLLNHSLAAAEPCPPT